jgi:hypothetical protein
MTRQGYGQRDYTPDVGREEQVPLMDVPLDLRDHAGRKRQGRAVLLPRWGTDRGGECAGSGEDFRVVLLSEPPEGPVSPAEGVVVSAPASPLAFAANAVGEVTAAYKTGSRSGLGLSPQDVELLCQGRLFAAAPLQVTAEEVFAEGKAHLDLLARDLLLSTAVAEYLSPVAIALYAPGGAKPADMERLQDLSDLIRAAGAAAANEAPEVKAALARLSQLASAADREQFISCAEQTYPEVRALMEDIYMLRSFVQSPQEANEILAMQRFLQQAIVPAEEADLALDRSLALEQLTYVTLAAEPQRFPPARAMLDSFRRKYVSEYRERHTRHWAQMARLHARLREEQTLVEALHRLNTLAELGPPAGLGALTAYEQLVAETADCPLLGGVEEMPEAEAICPACGLSLDETAPVQRVEEILQRIRRACEQQRARLSSSAVQQVLRRSNDARVEQFLRVVQASQLSSLPDILDDELAGYLRRFLVESRIQEAIEPILDQLQEGVTPRASDAQTVMQEVSRVLQRAFHATRKALPPGEPAVDESPPRRKRKR